MQSVCYGTLTKEFQSRSTDGMSVLFAVLSPVKGQPFRKLMRLLISRMVLLCRQVNGWNCLRFFFAADVFSRCLAISAVGVVNTIWQRWEPLIILWREIWKRYSHG